MKEAREHVRAIIIQIATRRCAPSTDPTIDIAAYADDYIVVKKQSDSFLKMKGKRFNTEAKNAGDEINRFCEQLREADLARVNFDKACFEHEMEEHMKNQLECEKLQKI